MNWPRRLYGTLLLAPASSLPAPAGLEFRTRLVVVLLIATVAFVAIAPDLELEPGPSRLVNSLLNSVSITRLSNALPIWKATNTIAILAEISRSRSEPCILELNCSRLC
jgi:hypothetical protein